MKLAVLSVLLLAGLVGCDSTHHGKPAGAQETKQQPPTYMIYSPNGEPLNGGPIGRLTCNDAMMRWFDRVDVNHDNKIDHDEFLADANIQFHRMDIDNNGYLVSEELERFRLPYRQNDTTKSPEAKSQADSSATPSDQHKHGRKNSGDNAQQTDNVSSALQPDPVMSADTNNDFRVSLKEFTTQAEAKFVELDSEHKGGFTREQLLKLCGQGKK